MNVEPIKKIREYIGDVVHRLPFNPLKDPHLLEVLEAEDGGIQFSHTLEEQIRGQIKAGFRLLDLYEDTNGSGFLHEMGVPTFWATLAVKERQNREGRVPDTTFKV